MKKMMKKIMLIGWCMFLLCMPAWAQGTVVDNGGQGLNMRSAPSQDASVIGKFVSGTPVQVLRDAGNGWSEVQVGCGQNVLLGYMNTSHLSESCAVDGQTVREVISPYGTPTVVLRDHASNSYNAVMMLSVGECVTVIGTSGNFYYVQTGNQTVGCLASNELR